MGGPRVMDRPLWLQMWGLQDTWRTQGTGFSATGAIEWAKSGLVLAKPFRWAMGSRWERGWKKSGLGAKVVPYPKGTVLWTFGKSLSAEDLWIVPFALAGSTLPFLHHCTASMPAGIPFGIPAGITAGSALQLASLPCTDSLVWPASQHAMGTPKDTTLCSGLPLLSSWMPLLRLSVDPPTLCPNPLCMRHTS